MVAAGLHLLTPQLLIALVACIEAMVESSPGNPKHENMFSLSSRNTDVILVSHQEQWGEAHTLFARRISRKITTWRIPNRMLRSHVLRNVEQGKKSVLVGADPGMPREDIPKLINGSRLGDLCVSWLFVRPQSEILSHATTPWKPVLACQKVFLLALNESVGSKLLRNVTQSTVSTHRFMGPLQGTEKYGPELKRLSGQKLTVACTKYASYGHNASSCDHAYASAIFRPLKAKYNASVDLRNVYSIDDLVRGMRSQEWDMIFIWAVIQEREVFLHDFPLIDLDHETFFSRKSAHRSVTLSEVGRESWSLMRATLALIGLVALTQVLETEGVRPTLRGATGTVSLLLASVLGTSTPEPVASTRSGRFLSRTLFGLWFVFVLPLSCYFRSELTSIVTLKRPAERIDTLEELENALDMEEVAPCAVENTEPHIQLMTNQSVKAQGSLMWKLRAAFRLHGSRQLSRTSYSDCLACALRRDRVCYTSLEYPCDLREKIPNVRELREHYNIYLIGLRVRKFLPAYRPLRRFFLAIQEGQLMVPRHTECSYNETAGIFEYDLNGLFVQHAMLQVVSSVVLVVEILIVWCSQINRRRLHA